MSCVFPDQNRARMDRNVARPYGLITDKGVNTFLTDELQTLDSGVRLFRRSVRKCAHKFF
jgi:hypothetical protein